MRRTWLCVQTYAYKYKAVSHLDNNIERAQHQAYDGAEGEHQDLHHKCTHPVVQVIV